MAVRRGLTWMRWRGGRSDERDEGPVFLCVGRVQLSSCSLVYFVVWDEVGSWHEAGQALFWHCIRKHMALQVIDLGIA